jgi:RNA polymerase sigma-70 factor, ECF subfamily
MLLTFAPPVLFPPRQEAEGQPETGTARNCVTSPEEISTITRVIAGDVNAFNAIVERYQRLAYSIAYRILHSEDAAGDAVQDSFIKAYRALASFRGGCFKSWLTRIVVNTCYDRLRGPDFRTTIALDDVSPTEEGNVEWVAGTESPEAHAQRREVRQWLERGLQVLPDDQRIVVLLYDVHGYAYDEIAEIIDAPLGTVKSRLNRGRLRLRDFLLKHDVLPADLARASQQPGRCDR